MTFLLFAPQLIFAADRTWTGATSTNWGTNGNWTGGQPSPGDNAVFNSTFSNQPNLASNQTAGGIWMTGSIGQNVTISGSTLTLQGNTINGTAGLGILVDNANAFTLTITAPVKVGNAQTWRNNSANVLTIGAGGVDTNSNTLTIDGSGNTTISGVVSGAGAITKAGSGNLVLSSSANTYSGTTTVNGGDLSTGTFTLTLTGAVSIASGATYTSTGTLNLTPDTTAAQTFISGAGALRLRNSSSTAGSPDIYYDPNGGNALGFQVIIGSNVDVGSGSRFINGKSNRNDYERYGGDLVFSGNLTGSANLTFTGTPNTGGGNPPYQVAYTLAGNNSGFSGGIILTDGANLTLNNANALTSANTVSFTPSSGAVSGLYLYGRSVTIGALSGTAAGTMNIRNGSLVTDTNPTINPNIVRSNAVLTVQQDTNTTFNGIMSDGPNDHGAGDSGTYYTLGLTKTGTGTLTLGGANTYTGKTTISSGALSVGSLNKVTGGSASSNLGAPTTVANATIDIGSTTTTGTLIYTGAGETTDRVINLAGTTGGGTIQNDGSGAVTFSSNLTATGAGSKTFTLQGSNAGGNTISGVIVDNSGSNTTSLTKAGAGTWVLSGVNTYTGGTTINAGTLQLGNANTSSGGALGKTTSASVTFGAGSTGKLQLNGNATTIIDLNTNATVGTPIIENGSSTTTAILTVNTANTDTYAGLLQDGSSKTLGLTKSGSGTLILTGLTNSQTGITNINGGILRASDITTYAAGNQNITSSILGQAPSNGVAFSGNNATLQLRYNGQSDSTSQTLTLPSSKGGALLVNASAPNATINVDRQGGSGTNKTIAFTSSTIASSNTLNVTGADGYNLGLGNLVVGSGGSAGNVTVNPTTANLTIGTATSSGTTNNHTLVLDGTSSGNTIAGAMANGGSSSVLSVTKQNTSSWTLSGASTYTGATMVNGGSLFVNGSTASGSAVTVNNSGSTLGGNGTINGTVNVASSGANLSPGATGVGSTAILHTGALTLSSGSNFNVDLNSGGIAGTNYDQVKITGSGTITLSNLVVTAGSGLAVNDKFFIMLDNPGSTITGTFAQGTTVTASNNGDIFTINYADNGDFGPLPNDISLTVTAIPEPSTWIAATLAFATLLFTQRRRLPPLVRRA